MTIDSIDHSWITQTFLVKQHFTSLGIQNSWLLYSNSKIGRRRKKSRRYYDRSLPAISNFPIVNHFWCSSHHQPGSLCWHVTTTMVGLRTWSPSPTSILSPGSLETMEMGNGEQKNKKKRAINIDYASDSESDIQSATTYAPPDDDPDYVPTEGVHTPTPYESAPCAAEYSESEVEVQAQEPSKKMARHHDKTSPYVSLPLRGSIQKSFPGFQKLVVPKTLSSSSHVLLSSVLKFGLAIYLFLRWFGQ